ncbi:hypothetical protein BOX15_Mlig021630g2, partial [Macrostomum lignano]
KLHAIPMLGGTVPFATVAAAALVCLLTALSVRPAGALTCSELNTTHKGVLQPLFGQSFTLTLSPSSNKIIVRICGPASDFELFADSAALLVPSHGSGGTVVKLGLVSSGQMYLGTGWMLLVYTGGDPYSASDNSGSNPQCNGSRSVRIVMECNPGIYAPELDFVGEIRNEPSQCHHLFSMQHYSLCGLIPDPAAGGSLAPLAVVIVAILAGFIAYLGVGMLIQRFYFGKRGAAQIPNYTAWQRFGNAAASCCDLVCRSEPRPPRARYADAASEDGQPGGVTTHHLYADQDDDHLLPG